MTFTVGYSAQFTAEWGQYQPDQKQQVAGFVRIFQQYGLGDQTKYPGRVSPSWHRLPPNAPQAEYARKHSLWHYHIGLPDYSGDQAWNRTSDWLLHFQWVDRGTHVDLVDIYSHYDWQGNFYIPQERHLTKDAPPEEPSA